MSILQWITMVTFLAGVIGTGMGGVISSLIRGESNKTASLLLSFAAGVMIAVVCFDLIPDAIASQENIGVSLITVIGGVGCGYIVVWVLNRLIDRATDHEVAHIDEGHPKTADDLDELYHTNHYEAHKKSSSSLFTAGLVMAVAIALHNLPEGMVIGASYAREAGSSNFAGSGIALAAVIGLHNIPEGMAIAVPLITGGMKKLHAILLTALSGSPTIIGAIIGYAFGTMGSLGLALSLSFASGAMLYVVFGELLPEVILLWRSKLPALTTVAGIMVGLIVVSV